MTNDFPLEIPPSPYPHVSGLEPGVVHTFEMAAYGQLLAERLADWLGAMRHVIAPARERHGSVLPGTTGMPAGLDYWVLDGTSPLLESLQLDAREVMLDRIERVLGLKLALLAEPDQRVNVNLLTPGPRSGYEWHYDPNPITAVLFLTDMPPGQGELVYRDAAGQLARVQPRRGRVAVGDFSQTLHGVRSFWAAPLRLSVPFGYGVPGHTEAKGSEFLYGREE